MVGWVAPFFLDDGKANTFEPADGPDEMDEERAG
jgi:hypothetical protein